MRGEDQEGEGKAGEKGAQDKGVEARRDGGDELRSTPAAKRRTERAVVVG